MVLCVGEPNETRLLLISCTITILIAERFLQSLSEIFTNHGLESKILITPTIPQLQLHSKSFQW